MNLFGNAAPKLTAMEQAKEWKRKISKESRSIDRDIVKLQREEKKSMAECKKLLKEGHKPAAKLLAKEVVNTRKAIERMHAAIAHLNSVSVNLQTSIC
jgi:charged multivesicular body protein 3